MLAGGNLNFKGDILSTLLTSSFSQLFYVQHFRESCHFKDGFYGLFLANSHAQLLAGIGPSSSSSSSKSSDAEPPINSFFGAVGSMFASSSSKA